MKPGYSRAIVNENIAQQCRDGVPLRIAIRRALDNARQEYRAKKPNGMLPYHLRLPDEKARTNQHYKRNPAPSNLVTVVGPLKTRKEAEQTARDLGAERHSVYSVERKDAEGYGTDVYDYYVERDNSIASKEIFGMTFEQIQAKQHKRNPVPPSSRVQIKEAAQLYADFSGHEPEIIGELDKPVIPDVLIGIGEVDGILYSTVRDGVLEKYVHRFAKKARPLFAVSHDGKQLFMLGGAYNFTERGIVDET